LLPCESGKFIQPDWYCCIERNLRVIICGTPDKFEAQVLGEYVKNSINSANERNPEKPSSSLPRRERIDDLAFDMNVIRTSVLLSFSMSFYG